jgi:photosystem II stability/assembly factor-like uncharacterized protein
MRRPLFLAAVAALALGPGALQAADAVNPDLLAGLEARSIGPAAMSGRVADIDVVESNPDIIYIGTATGGVWKSVNGGLTWDPIFDDQPVHSIGAVAVFQPNPDIVWAGSGEGNVRNSVSIGNGVYRSLDGGETWSHLGLEKTERIHRVVLHPTDPDVAWVAALGQLWGENADRGVFKTTDGGKTWRKVLFVNNKTGAADLLADPSNPNKLFAAMWEFRRWPWLFTSGGRGSGLHVSHDGGETWKRLTEDDGLPKGELGRIGLAASRSNPNIVYALVENAAKNQILRSDDGGLTWKKAGEDIRATERPFYYADLKVDPVWPNRVYSLTARLLVSNDSGASFDILGRSREIHSDHHDLWINPRDPEHMILANDGGLGISRDRGETWQFVGNLPLAQFYHIAVDMDRPYNVYGGLQDNGSWRGPSSLWEQGGGIRNSSWTAVGGGDGFDTRPDPEDSMAGYSMSQGGELTRWNLKTRESKSIKPPEPAPGSGRERLRFNWNAGLAQDPFEPGTIYYGSQYVHKSTDRGDSWTIISPDLTTDNPEWQQQARSGGLTLDVSAAENHTTIIAIAPSAKQKGVLWVGSDDGRLHVTRDGGQTWTSVEKNVPGVPANTWIPHITPSKHDAASAFVVFDNHRRADFATYVYRTDDWGKTWKSLAAKNIRGYALAIEQDPVDKDLLFLGTELGLWASLDGGARWMQWKQGVPTASVMDLVIHPRDHDLVLATHGRAIYVIDDISPLRDLSAETMAKPVHLHPTPPALLYRAVRSRGVRGGGAGEYQGENRDYGALITFSLNAPGLPLPDEEQERARKEAERVAERARLQPAAQAGAAKQEDPPPSEAAPAEAQGRRGGGGPKGPQVEIKISDASGKVVRTIKADAKRGLNRVVWDLGRDEFRMPPNPNRGGFQGANAGPPVVPGVYNVAVKYGKEEAKGTLKVEADPQLGSSQADWQAWDANVARVGQLQSAVTEAIERVAATRADVGVVLSKLDARAKARERSGQTGDNPDRDLQKAARDLQKKLDEVERKLYVPPGTKGIVEDNTAQNSMGDLRRFVGSSFKAPTGTVKGHMETAEATVREVLAEVNKLYAEDVPAFRQKVTAAQIDLLGAQGPIEVK